MDGTEKPLYDALVAFLKARGEEIDLKGPAMLTIPLKGGGRRHVPIPLLENAH